MNLPETTAFTRPPAKLNLFLELLNKRPDGFHEIDTVMIAIDLCDEMRVWRSDSIGVQLSVDWLPSKELVANRLGIQPDSAKAAQLLQIPENESNLVFRALNEFATQFDVGGGFGCDLKKRIPAGAGMGGASSDAASALLCAAKLCDIPVNHPNLLCLAASLGSDVPYFLGCGGPPMRAARATGRGEIIEAIDVGSTLHFVVVYPNDSLSTPAVYQRARVPKQPKSSDAIIGALATGNLAEISAQLSNRLADPAKKILPRIDEILESLWRSDMRACQLTGSGSACFAIADSSSHADRCEKKLRATLEPGAFVTSARSVKVPAEVTIRVRTDE